MNTPNKTHDITAGWRLCAWLGVLSVGLVGFTSRGFALTSYSQNFSGGTAPNWSVVSGTWSVSSGKYNNTAYNTTTGLGISVYTGTAWSTNYIYRIAVQAPWTASGNDPGVVFNYQDANDYYYILYNMAGYAELDKLVSGTKTTIATAATGTFGGGGANFWEDVEVDVSGTSATVHINGARVFNNVSLSGSALPSGEIGLLSSWNEGSFTNVSVTPLPTTAYTDSFSSGSTTGWTPIVGTWSASSPAGSYQATAYNTTTGLAISVNTTATYTNDYTFSGSVNSNWINPGNEMGLVFNYVNSSNYYDVLVSESGNAGLQETVSGTTTTVATVPPGTFKGGGENDWIDICVQVLPSGNVTVFVNGQGIFTNQALTSLGAGDIGYVARFDSTCSFQFTQVSNGLVPYKRIFPKIGQLLIDPAAYDSYASTMAQYDMVFLGVYNAYAGGYGGTTPAKIISDIKAANDATLVGNYSDVMETLYPSTTGEADYDVYTYLGNQTGPTGNGGTWTPNDWWARDDTGAHVSEFSGDDETNITCFVTPDSNNWRWSQWFANRENNLIYSQAPYDIWFSDNTFYEPRSNADWNRSGTDASETNSTVQAYYRQGMAAYFQRLTQFEPGMLLMGNVDGNGGTTGHLSASTPEYQGYLPCALLEGEMGASWSEETWGGWSFAMGSYDSMMSNTAWPNLVLFGAYGTTTGTSDTNPTNYSNGANYAYMRYALCSTLMNNGYFGYSVGVGNYNVSGMQMFDEYSVILGIPLQGPQTSAWSNGVYARLFQNGLVLCNPQGNGSQTVNVTTLGSGLFKHFQGTQDTTTNNGANVTTVTLGNGDGLVLINQP